MDSGNATCANQYSCNTVIENPSNAKEIWGGHGIQAWTPVSCFDHSCTELLGNLGPPLTLKRTWIYALVISSLRISGTLTFVKTIAVSSTVRHVLLYTAIFAFVYQMPPIFPALRGQCKKLIYSIFARLYPCHVRGIGCMVKTDWYTYWERAHLQQKADAWDI